VSSATASILFAGVAVAEIGHAMGRWSLPLSPPGAAFHGAAGRGTGGDGARRLAELRAFEAAALDDPYAGRPGLLGAIDRDVLVIFVESYGRASLDTPLYADTHRATLEAAEGPPVRAGPVHAVGLSGGAHPRRAKLAQPRDLRQRALDRRSDELRRGSGQRPAVALPHRVGGGVPDRRGHAADHARLARGRPDGLRNRAGAADLGYAGCRSTG
jgi:hypothetical protein